MNNKPQMKREVSVTFHHEGVREIAFYSTPDAVTEFWQYGCVISSDKLRNYYRLIVDARYDFAEVLEFIQNYG